MAQIDSDLIDPNFLGCLKNLTNLAGSKCQKKH